MMAQECNVIVDFEHEDGHASKTGTVYLTKGYHFLRSDESNFG